MTLVGGLANAHRVGMAHEIQSRTSFTHDRMTTEAISRGGGPQVWFHFIFTIILGRSPLRARSTTLGGRSLECEHPQPGMPLREGRRTQRQMNNPTVSPTIPKAMISCNCTCPETNPHPGIDNPQWLSTSLLGKQSPLTEHMFRGYRPATEDTELSAGIRPPTAVRTNKDTHRDLVVATAIA